MFLENGADVKLKPSVDLTLFHILRGTLTEVFETGEKAVAR